MMRFSHKNRCWRKNKSIGDLIKEFCEKKTKQSTEKKVHNESVVGENTEIQTS